MESELPQQVKVHMDISIVCMQADLCGAPCVAIICQYQECGSSADAQADLLSYVHVSLTIAQALHARPTKPAATCVFHTCMQYIEEHK